MIIQGSGNVAAAYSTVKTLPAQRQTFSSYVANTVDRVSFSDAGRAMTSASNPSGQETSIEMRLDAIKEKPAVARTFEDWDFVNKHDKRLAEIQAKDVKTRTADEVDYMQKAGGLVNTMAYLSPKERALYDELVAKGNWDAAGGLIRVGMTRSGMSGQQVRLPNGRVFDPLTTEVTADNIRNLFKYMFADDSGADRQFDALASYLDQREITDK